MSSCSIAVYLRVCEVNNVKNVLSMKVKSKKDSDLVKINESVLNTYAFIFLLHSNS